MVDFNPSFHFDADESIQQQFDAFSETLPSHVYKIDKLIDMYRANNALKVPEDLNGGYEVEETDSGSVQKIIDSLRDKSKHKSIRKSDQEWGKQEEVYEFMQTVTKYTEVESFIYFKLSKPLLKALTEMKLSKPTPIQCACVPLGLLNRDICACALTGSGKTLAFLLPIIERMVYAPSASRRTTRALIISPTRELAVQIFKVAGQLVKHCPRVKIQLAAGGLDISSQEASLRTNPDIVVATPGRLIDHLSNAPNFTLSGIEYLVLDEADKLLDEYFTEQVKEIVRHCSAQRQTMLFSATMTESVRELVTMSLKNPVRIFLNESTAVASRLEQEFVRIRPHRECDRDAILAALLFRSFPHSTIVFLPTKRDCHRVHVLLGLMGLKCAELHGDLDQAQRLEALRRFTDAEKHHDGLGNRSTAAKTPDVQPTQPSVDILLATDLVSRGLDIPNVQTVINYKLPRDIKSYVHRVGRTARATNSGRAVSLAGEEDRKLLKAIVKGAPYPVKSRVIATEVIARFQAKIDKVKPFMKEILAMEMEERELNAAQSQLAKAESLAKVQVSGNPEAIAAAFKPKRVNWFSEKREAESVAKRKRNQKRTRDGEAPEKRHRKK